jgi:phosphoribosyl 1,2-cyclic phosphate phosphodiesterase
MEVIILGSGTSQGVPMIGCPCAVCHSPDPRNRRTRTSVHVVMDGLHVQVDAAPELRLQCLQQGVAQVDLFILTHGHTDHIVGMDDLRRFCDMRDGGALPIYTTPEGRSRVQAIFPYAIVERARVGGYPAFRLLDLPAVLDLPQGTIHSTLLPHGGTQTLGLVFTERSSGRRFAYYTDCKALTAEAVALAQGVDALVIDGLRPLPHPSHLSIAEAIAAARALGAGRVWLTHLTHLTDHATTESELAPGTALAYDGLRISL